MEALRTVLAKLGFQIDTKELDHGSKRFDKFLNNVKAGFYSIVAARGAMDFFGDQIKQATELKMLSSQLGLTTDELQKYEYSAKQVGLTTQQMVTAFKVLENHVGASATLTGMQHGIKMFGQYGISTRDAEGKLQGLPEMLGQIADKMKGMEEPARKVRFANEMMGEMGFRLIPLLEQGSEGVKAFYKDFEKLNLTIKKGFIEAGTRAGQRLKTMQTALNVFKSELAWGALPTIERMTNRLSVFISGLTKMARATTLGTTVWAAFAATVVYGIAQMAGGFRMLFAWLLRFSVPLLIVGALYLIFDDLYNLIAGNDSLIGRMLDHFFGVGTAAEMAKELRDVWGEIKQGFSELEPILKIVGPLLRDLAKVTIAELVNQFIFFVRLLSASAKIFRFVAEFVGESAKSLADLYTKGPDFSKGETSTLDAIGERLSFVARAASRNAGLDKITDTKFWQNKKGDSLLPGTQIGKAGANVVLNNVFEINAEGRDVGEAAKRGVEKAQRQSNTEFLDAVRATLGQDGGEG